MQTWSNGKIIYGKVGIDSLNFALHYGGPNAWEGIRAYEQANGSTRIFKLHEHINRLFDTAKIVGFKIPYSKTKVKKACQEVVEANGGGDLYLRPIAYTAQEAEPIRPQPQQEINLDIYCFPIPKLHNKKNIKIAISNLVRSYPHYEMQAKTAHNYHFLQEAKREMLQRGVDDVLLLDSNGHVTEATVANLWLIKKGIAITPPNDGSILPGITRECVYTILKNAGYMVAEKKVTRADLYTADFVFLCGTYAEIVKVLEIDGREIGSKELLDDVEWIQKQYERLARGGFYRKKSQKRKEA